MRKTKIGIVSVLAMSLALGATAYASTHKAEEGMQGIKQKAEKLLGLEETTGLQKDFRTTEDFVGMEVRNEAGDNIGEVKNLLIDADGRIRFVVIETGEVLGLGGTQHYLPYQAFRDHLSTEGNQLQIKRDTLANAPEMKPGMSGDQYGREVYEYYGQAPYWTDEGQGTQKMMDKEKHQDMQEKKEKMEYHKEGSEKKPAY